MKKKKLTVGITGMNATPDNPAPGIAVARCIQESSDFDVRIIALGYDAYDAGLYLSKYCDKSYLLPYPSAGESALMARLSTIHAEEQLDVLIPCLDAELLSMTRLQPVLEQMGIRMFLPSTQQLQLRNKEHLDLLSQQAGISSPATRCINNIKFFYECIAEGWQYPFVVKGRFYDAQIVCNADEGVSAFQRIAAQWGVPILVQRLIRGEEYNVTALGDGRGKMLGPVMMKKVALTDKGKGWAGVCIADAVLHNTAEALIRTLQWQGPVEIELIRDKQGKYQLIEINPRFPAWIYLSVGVGRNLPAALLQLIEGRKLQEFPPAGVGTMFIRHSEEMIVELPSYESLIMHGVGQTYADSKLPILTARVDAA